jgi:hypothetical protein
LERLTVASEASATVSGKRNGNVKVALNSNQVKSLQAGVHADGGGLYLVVRESGDRVWAFRFTDLDSKRAQMEFARIGDRDSAASDVLTLSSARNKAREYKVALKRDGVDPRSRSGPPHSTTRRSRNLPRSDTPAGARVCRRKRRSSGRAPSATCRACMI